MKKVLICSAFIEPHIGGVERYVKKIANEFGLKNIEVTIVTSNYNNDLYYEEKNNIKIYKLPVFSLFKNRYPIVKKNKIYKSQIREIFSSQYDLAIINTRFYYLNVLVGTIAFKKNIPIFLIEHGSNYLTLNNKIIDFFIRIVEKYFSKKSKKITSRCYGVSKAASEWIGNFNFKSSGELYNCIDLNDYSVYHNKKNRFIQKKKNEIIIMFAGRLVNDKGVKYLVDAFLILKKKYSNIRLLICGDGPLYDYIKNINDKDIYLTGAIGYDDIMPCYDIADIFVNPSRSEGLPTSLLEAGLMKCALIATNVGGTNEIIENNKLGILIDYSQEATLNALDKLLCNVELIDEYKEKIHNQIIIKFSSKSVANKIIEEYNEMKSEKKISLVTVCYNSEKTIENTLKSVLNQNYSNYEYLIIDGKSTDKTLDIVNEYKDKFKGKLIIKSEKDKGIYDAMNKGVKLASGEIVGLLNSDDCLYNEDVFIKINNMMSENIDYVYGDMIINSDDKLKIPKRVFKTGKGNYRLGWMPPHPTFYVRKKVYDEIGLYNIKFKIAADYDFMLRVFKKKKYKGKYIDSIIVEMNPGGASTNGVGSHLKSIKDAYKVMINNRLFFPLTVSFLKFSRTTLKAIIAKITKKEV